MGSLLGAQPKVQAAFRRGARIAVANSLIAFARLAIASIPRAYLPRIQVVQVKRDDLQTHPRKRLDEVVERRHVPRLATVAAAVLADLRASQRITTARARTIGLCHLQEGGTRRR